MNEGVVIQRCTGCNATYFPARLLCPRCRRAEFADETIHMAVVEEVTVVRHVLAQEGWEPKRIANVRTPDGMPMTVGLLDDSDQGTAISLFQDGLAPFGRRTSQ